jgi:hypothetical protein
MACCQKATRDEAKRKHASKSRETAQTERAARGRSRQASLWLHYAKHLAIGEDQFTTFVVKMEKKLGEAIRAA